MIIIWYDNILAIFIFINMKPWFWSLFSYIIFIQWDYCDLNILLMKISHITMNMSQIYKNTIYFHSHSKNNKYDHDALVKVINFTN